ncbi:MAG TPA: hypothetical protein VFQ89_09290, partial [Candidatus Binatia bacterium]|nr:hypothetical protein [Candidatus Binatia bacterium]
QAAAHTVIAADHAEKTAVAQDIPAVNAHIDALEAIRKQLESDGPITVPESVRAEPERVAEIEKAISEAEVLPAENFQEMLARRNEEYFRAYADKTYDELSALRESAIEQNNAIEREAVRRFFGPETAKEFAAKSRRGKDAWLEKNLSPEQEDYLQARYLPEQVISDYVRAVNNFDPSSPAALGRSLLLAAKNLDDPGYFHSPEFVTFRNALRFANEQGWDLDAVTAGLRDRVIELYGDDSRELFERLFRMPNTEGKDAAPALPRAEVAKEPVSAGLALAGDALSKRADLAGQIKSAVDTFQSFSKSGESVEQFLARQDVANRNFSPEMDNLLLGISENASHPARIAELVRRTIDEVTHSDGPLADSIANAVESMRADAAAPKVEGDAPEFAAVSEIFAQGRDVTVKVIDEAGNEVEVSARELMADVEANIAQTQKDSKAFEAAVTCFLRG